MSQRDIKLRLKAGESMPVRTAGDFIFVKFAERPVVVRVNGQAITMQAGDKQRLARDQRDAEKPAFTEFDLDNSDSEFPLAVILVVGVGDYSRQIISGEVTATSGVRRADGTWADDTRYQLPVTFALDPSYVAQNYVYQAVTTWNKATTVSHCPMTINQRGNLIFKRATTFDANNCQDFDEFTPEGAFVGTFKLKTVPAQQIEEICIDYTRPEGGSYIAAIAGDLYRVTQSAAVLLENLNPATWALDSSIAVDASTGQLFAIAYHYSTAKRNLRRYQIKDDGTLAFIETILLQDILGGFGARGVWAEGGSVYISNASGATPATRYIYEINPDTKAIVATVGGWEWTSGASYRRLVRAGNFWYGIGDSTGTVVSRVANVAFTRSARGFARHGRGDGGLRIFKLNYSTAFLTSAVMSVTNIAAGKRLSGQLIRAALELYFGRTVSDDYLDSVFGVTIHSSAEQSELLPVQDIQANGKSFAAAGIADNFDAVIPGYIELTVDRSLTFI